MELDGYKRRELIMDVVDMTREELSVVTTVGVE